MSGAPALVVLAAGASERLGACKALVDLAGATPLARLLAAGACMDGAPPLVVAGAHTDAIERALPRGVELVRNERWREGRSGSIALAVRARPGFDLCLAPIDVPLVEPRVFAALRAAWIDAPGETELAWLAPCTRVGLHGAATLRHGHPLVVGAELAHIFADEVARTGAGAWNDFPLRALRARARAVMSVEVASERILDDLDTPEDLARLQREAARADSAP